MLGLYQLLEVARASDETCPLGGGRVGTRCMLPFIALKHECASDSD
jgi:hypothetical protein